MQIVGEKQFVWDELVLQNHLAQIMRHKDVESKKGKYGLQQDTRIVGRG